MTGQLPWDAISAIGETISALAVVGSLIYLAIQIKTQNRESRITAVHNVLEAYRNQLSLLTEEDFSQLFVRGMTDCDELNEAEMMRLVSGILGVFRVWEEAFYLLREARLDENHFAGMNRLCIDLVASESGKRAWERGKNGYSIEFQAYVNSQVKSAMDARNT